MPSCCVPKCKSNYKKDGPKYATFGLPQNPELLEKWRQKIPRQDRVLKPKTDRVCELHFTQDQIIRTFDVTIGGKLESIQRERPALKPGSIPCIFPNCPKYLSTASKVKNFPKKRMVPNMARKNGKDDFSVFQSPNTEKYDSIVQQNGECNADRKSLKKRNEAVPNIASENAEIIF